MKDRHQINTMGIDSETHDLVKAAYEREKRDTSYDISFAQFCRKVFADVAKAEKLRQDRE